MSPCLALQSRRVAGRTVAAAGLAVLVTLTPAAASAPRASGWPALAVPGTACPLLPGDNVWHTDVSALPVDPDGDTWLESMNAASTELHPDFGPPSYGIPFGVVGDRTRRVDVAFRYARESDRKRYPLTKHTRIEGESDRHAIIVDKSSCTLYELFSVRWNGGHPTADSGAIFQLGSNALRPDGYTSADAAGLPILPGLLRYDEVKAGEIDHAIRFTADSTQDRHVWPARHDAGLANEAYPPMGARFRLRADFDISGYGASAQVVLRAMKTYGLILADNGSNWYFQGTVDDRWTNGLLDQLKQVPASAFEAVDTSSCGVSPDSAQSSC
jgi:hypothetical protein